MNSKPIVTLCVLAYNRPKDLENTIKSYLSQSYENSEMIIIDDRSPTDLTPTVGKWQKKDKRIRFYRNKKNLGLSKNFFESFKYCRGKYIVTLGDDDVFINKDALKEYVGTFESNKEIGVLRSRQVIIRNNKLYQVSSMGKNNVEIFDKAKESLDNFVIDTISMAGNSYRNNNILRSSNSYFESTYPQVELSAKISLFSKTATINKYLIGVGSGENQLNVLTYKLSGINTNILEDFSYLLDRVNKFAKKKNKTVVNKKSFMEKVIDSIIILLPYDSLRNGKFSTLKFVSKMIQRKKQILLNPTFAISIGIVIMPDFFVRRFLKFANKFKLKRSIKLRKVIEINKNLERIILL